MRVSARSTSSSWRTTFSSLSIVSFLASPDRVKGSDRNLSGGSDALRRRGRPVLATLACLALGPALELGAAPLREGHLDRVEVAWRLGGREHRSCLIEQLPARIAA